MRRAVAALALGLALAAPAAPPADARDGVENRCGILSNPTPANWWLTDRDGEWIISIQGGYQAEGMETMPESLFERGWIRVNGYYGYRCACLGVETDRAAMRVLRVHSGKPRPMAACKADKALQRALLSGSP